MAAGNVMTAMTPSLAERIRDELDALTASERKAGRALLANYPLLGLETAAGFAVRAGVSSPSILRFISRIGFANYAEFQRHLRDELEAQIQSPLTRTPARTAARQASRPHHYAFADAVADNIRETFQHLPQSEFDSVVRLLADPKRPVHALGGRFTDAIARYMTAHLRILRPNVHHLEGQTPNWQDQVLDMSRKDVLVLVDVRRYQENLLRLAQGAAKQHATVILLTDQWLSPIAVVAAHVLPVRIGVPSAWDSSSALMAVAEALIAEVTAGDWDRSQKRMAALEGLREQSG
jgi:DNA-binding MurR/RpiR family transcriptional regulator